MSRDNVQDKPPRLFKYTRGPMSYRRRRTVHTATAVTVIYTAYVHTYTRWADFHERVTGQRWATENIALGPRAVVCGHRSRNAVGAVGGRRRRRRRRLWSSAKLFINEKHLRAPPPFRTTQTTPIRYEHVFMYHQWRV